MSTTLLHVQHHPQLSSPPSSFTPPRSPRHPTPSPPPSPSPRAKGKARALVNVVPVPQSSEQRHHEDGDDEGSSTNNSPSKPSTSTRRTTGGGLVGGRKLPTEGIIREERTKGDARKELPEGSDGEEENGWGWEEEHLWGENFWVTLQDLSTQAIFFANPRTGECSWQPPNGVYVLPIPPTGQWWCLNDPNRSNLPYFYHTLSRETRWTKPDVPLIIPLASIQMNTLGAPPSKSFQRRRSASALAAPPTTNSSSSLLSVNSNSPSKMRTSTTRTQKSSAPPSTTHGRGGVHQQSFSAAAEELQYAKTAGAGVGSPPMESRNSSSGSGKGTPEKSGGGGGGVLAMGRRIRERAMSGPMAPPAEPTTEGKRPKLERLRTDLKGRNIGEPSLDLSARTRMSPVKTSSSDGPVVVPPSINTKRFSTGEHRILPTDLSSEIQQFSVKEFADRFFSTNHTQGVLWRKKVPVEKMMVWQKAAITTPLLTLSSSLKSTAVKIFKVIQRAMGERDRVVDIPTLSTSSSTSSSNSGHGLAGAKSSPPPMLTDREVMLSEVRWMLSVGISHVELRDEVYSQLVKQLSQNPNLSRVFRGWELLSVLVVTFSPSKNFAAYLKTFIKSTTRSTDQTDEIGARVQIMASHCLKRLLANKPPKGKAPTILEIESAMGAAFNPSVFGSTLTQTLQIQSELYPDGRVPIILPFLANGVLALGGACTEGIFRVPGDGDGVAMLKDRIDRGQYQLSGVDDPNIPASLFKLWLRELQEPLIPPNKYNAALAVAGDPDAVCDLIRTLPRINRAVVVFTISFLQLLLAHQTETKMTEMNLATIFAPNLLRCPVDASLPEAFTVASAVPTQFVNSAFERSFVLNLLRRLVPEEIDDYIPQFGVPPSPPQSSPPRQRNGTA